MMPSSFPFNPKRTTHSRRHPTNSSAIRIPPVRGLCSAGDLIQGERPDKAWCCNWMPAASNFNSLAKEIVCVYIYIHVTHLYFFTLITKNGAENTRSYFSLGTKTYWGSCHPSFSVWILPSPSQKHEYLLVLLLLLLHPQMPSKAIYTSPKPGRSPKVAPLSLDRCVAFRRLSADALRSPGRIGAWRKSRQQRSTVPGLVTFEPNHHRILQSSSFSQNGVPGSSLSSKAFWKPFIQHRLNLVAPYVYKGNMVATQSGALWMMT